MPFLDKCPVREIEAIEQDTTLDENQKLSLRLILANGMLHATRDVHALGVIHRDIKPESFRINRDGVVRSIDFGFSYKLRDDETSYATDILAGTARYIHPNLYRGGEKSYNFATDYYALSMTIAISIFGKDIATQAVMPQVCMYNLLSYDVIAKLKDIKNKDPGINKIINSLCKALIENMDVFSENPRIFHAYQKDHRSGLIPLALNVIKTRPTEESIKSEIKTALENLVTLEMESTNEAYERYKELMTNPIDFACYMELWEKNQDSSEQLAAFSEPQLFRIIMILYRLAHHPAELMDEKILSNMDKLLNTSLEAAEPDDVDNLYRDLYIRYKREGRSGADSIREIVETTIIPSPDINDITLSPSPTP